MEITVVMSGGKTVDAQVGKHVIKTDQPIKEGGGGTAPAPFAYCLASMGTCAAYYVYKYLESRDLPLEGLDFLVHLSAGGSAPPGAHRGAHEADQGRPEDDHHADRHEDLNKRERLLRFLIFGF